MNEQEAKEALAHCAVYDFNVDSHFMRRKFDDGNAVVVYKLEPMDQQAGHAIVMQRHKPQGTPQADFYRDVETFKADLAEYMATAQGHE